MSGKSALGEAMLPQSVGDVGCGKPSDLDSIVFSHGGVSYAQGGEDKYVCV